MAKKITSGNNPAQSDPAKLNKSPKNQILMNPMAIPSADFNLHCSINCGISNTIQHANLRIVNTLSHFKFSMVVTLTM